MNFWLQVGVVANGRHPPNYLSDSLAPASRVRSIHGLPDRVRVASQHLRGPGVNEFYKKGCQEKSSASTGGSRFFLEIQPTLFRYL